MVAADIFSLFKGLFNGAEIEISLMKICTATLPISQHGPSLFPSMTLPISQHDPPYFPVTPSLFPNITLHISLYNPP